MIGGLLRRRRSQTVGVDLSEEGPAVAALERNATVRFWGDGEGELPALVRRAGLRGSRAVGVLPRHDYLLYPIEVPEVPPAEMAGAARWLIKDLLPFPVDQAVVDCFEQPRLRAPAGGRRHVVAVAAHRKAIEAARRRLAAAGLEAAALDIREMAMRNLAAELPEQGGGLALLHWDGTTALVTISRGGQLMLARLLETEGGGDPADSLALELQRSLDYYERQLAAAPASRLLVGGPATRREGLIEALAERLTVPCQPLRLADVVRLAEPVDDDGAHQGLLAVGAVLRGGLRRAEAA